MNWHVQFAPEALDQLRRPEKRIANAGSPITAERYVDSIVDFCMQLQTFPARGVARDDLLLGLRVTHFRKRVIISARFTSARSRSRSRRRCGSASWRRAANGWKNSRTSRCWCIPPARNTASA
ncbi:type II toxin-antitoxin system RelE/ParE family toxin [Caballeronia sp. ATUFL_M1_KS5A]|uniref:type II toxin-antitoxin system RelE/ParE family toxin n=1 Tax=Caballeronia sp. ATUFL_M1_KS5A TaxID=2921778 RepID=UPI0032EE28E9